MKATSRRRRRRQENRIKLLAGLTATAVLLIFLFNVVLSTTEVQGDMDVSSKGYITVTVHAEDTLWSIAGQYMNQDYYTYESFIAEVSTMNNIEPSEIYAGEKILIPVIASAD